MATPADPTGIILSTQTIICLSDGSKTLLEILLPNLILSNASRHKLFNRHYPDTMYLSFLADTAGINNHLASTSQHYRLLLTLQYICADCMATAV